VWQYEDAVSKHKGLCAEFRALEQEGYFQGFFEAEAGLEAWSVHSCPTPHTSCPPSCIPVEKVSVFPEKG